MVMVTGRVRNVDLGVIVVEDEYSEWTFEFAVEGEHTEEKEKDVVNQFQLRGHGSDKKTKLHEIRHIVMNNHSLSR